ncbi:hypothetical protein RclHR1_07920004 [Rhizophagus clarus]|uniref:Uncharacterized protein n=1 Tax=Rhizophagus clarus TaxID=94130 RepID=A0A2Z6SMH8_9GLOM|nr:hypothetical protein RclHR1_07920004 [Rhizophagus clarus]
MCEQKARDVDDFFKSQPASRWSFELYINNFLADPDLGVSFDQLLSTFVDSLDQINKLHTVPLTIRSNCSNYINWLQVPLPTGESFVCERREIFYAKINLEKNFQLNSVFKKSVDVTAQTRGFKTFLQPVPSAFPSETPKNDIPSPLSNTSGSSNRTLVNTISTDKEMCVSENNEDSETNDLDTPDHEEAIDDQEEVKEESNNKEVEKENQVYLH